MAVFLAGPTPRSPDVPSWRPEALALLAEAGFRGAVFVPETATGECSPDYDDQVEWERQGLNFADRILFWIPRDLERMPALTTNVEFGRWCTSGKVVLGFPPSAPKNKYLKWLASVEGVPVYHTLRETIAAALDGSTDAPERRGGERHVPLHVWRTASFQAWHQSLQRAGNSLEEARLLWSFCPRGTCHTFAHVLHARIWVAAEGRHKDNEWVLSRPDISCVVLYHRPVQADPLDTQIVLVREFRAAARTADGFIRELPGGSHAEAGWPPHEVALAEVHEETGLLLAGERLRRVGSRQLAGTLSSHHGHVFAAELTDAELTGLRERATTGAVGGVAADTEQTFIEVVTVRELLGQGLADWATVGMVMQALT
jgi:8-oxo-dGTP pyrophosphatase MutT (NUDIX family)